MAGKLTVTLILLLLGGVVVHFFGGYTQLVCDRDEGACTLTRINLGGVDTRRLPLGDVLGATTASSNKPTRRRMVINTRDGSVPFTRFYSGPGFAQKFMDRPHRARQRADRLNAFLENDSASLRIVELHLLANLFGALFLALGLAALFGRAEKTTRA
jgi:hypothetical protein